jgi:hypothetical protein
MAKPGYYGFKVTAERQQALDTISAHIRGRNMGQAIDYALTRTVEMLQQEGHMDRSARVQELQQAVRDTHTAATVTLAEYISNGGTADEYAEDIATETVRGYEEPDTWPAQPETLSDDDKRVIRDEAARIVERDLATLA